MRTVAIMCVYDVSSITLITPWRNSQQTDRWKNCADHVPSDAIWSNIGLDNALLPDELLLEPTLTNDQWSFVTFTFAKANVTRNTQASDDDRSLKNTNSNVTTAYPRSQWVYSSRPWTIKLLYLQIRIARSFPKWKQKHNPIAYHLISPIHDNSALIKLLLGGRQIQIKLSPSSASAHQYIKWLSQTFCLQGNVNKTNILQNSYSRRSNSCDKVFVSSESSFIVLVTAIRYAPHL